VTDEGPEKTEPWIKSKKARHPYAYDWTGELSNYFGIRGIPHSVLVDPSGRIVWRGHPNELQEGQIRPLLAKVWPDDVRSAIRSGQYAKALSTAQSNKERGAEIAARIKSSIEQRFGRLTKFYTDKDYLALDTEASYYEKAFADLPEGKQLTTLLEKVRSDPAAQAALQAQKRIREMLASLEQIGMEKAKKELKAIAAEHKGTAAAREAEYIISQI